MRRHKVDQRRLGALIDSFPSAGVTVVGDLILDHYIWGQVQRISPEAPVPVVEVREESRRLGGASNVANNIRELGGRVEIAGTLGDDEPGEWLAGELSGRGIGTGGVVRVAGRPTTVKTRIIAHGQQVVRVDRERKDHLPARAAAAIRRHLDVSLGKGGTVVVSDYGKGVISGPILHYLRERSGELGLRVCVDPKSRHFGLYRGFTLVTPNLREAEAAANMEISDDQSLKRAGRKLMASLETGALLVTRGEAGMTLFHGGEVDHLPTMAREVYDVTGAGDTVLATLALSLAAGASLLEAALLANLAAGLVVAEVGTSTVSRTELAAALENIPPYEENHG